MKRFVVVVGVLVLVSFILTSCAGNKPPTLTAVTKDGQTFDSKKVTIEIKSEDKDLPAGKKLKYSWDFGDGKKQEKEDVAGSVKIEYTYAKSGKYTVKVVATDDKGAKSKELVIKDLNVKNASPTAAATANPTKGPAPLKVSFDGGGSKDTDGQIAKYEWDFGDGSPKTMGAKVDHTYNEPKTYNVTLTVTDDEGATATTRVTITVEAPAPPVVEVQMLLTPDNKFVFEPAVVKIQPGQTVRWVCKSGCPHTATSYDKAVPTGGPTWDSKLLSEGQTFEFKFPANAPEGSYPYFCIPHEAAGQVGIIVVGKYTELSADFLNSLPPAAKAEMQKLIEQAKKL